MTPEQLLYHPGSITNRNADERAHMLLYLRGVGLIVKGALFVGVVVAHIKNVESEKWLATPVLVLGILPLIYRVYLDFTR